MISPIIPASRRGAPTHLGATGLHRELGDTPTPVDSIDRIDDYRARVSEAHAWTRRDFIPRVLRGEAIQSAMHRRPIGRHRALVVLPAPAAGANA